ncbi:hypothetical protein [Mesorhizobium sp.]|uniref:hypothetical protein n=1 Tax=Mesorhizobium sp. TaxID=1871066 RepID=UPI0025F2F335|nr:hypothetical protein [Mesorhizobium sp.]
MTQLLELEKLRAKPDRAPDPPTASKNLRTGYFKGLFEFGLIQEDHPEAPGLPPVRRHATSVTIDEVRSKARCQTCGSKEFMRAELFHAYGQELVRSGSGA